MRTNADERISTDGVDRRPEGDSRVGLNGRHLSYHEEGGLIMGAGQIGLPLRYRPNFLR